MWGWYHGFSFAPFLFQSHQILAAMLDAIDNSIAENVHDIGGGSPVDEHDNRRTELSGPLLVAAITSVCSSGFLLFGYDQGVYLDQPVIFPSLSI